VNSFNDMVQGLSGAGVTVVGSVLNDVPGHGKAKVAS
jgi:hypothetical protein